MLLLRPAPLWSWWQWGTHSVPLLCHEPRGRITQSFRLEKPSETHSPPSQCHIPAALNTSVDGDCPPLSSCASTWLLSGEQTVPNTQPDSPPVDVRPSLSSYCCHPRAEANPSLRALQRTLRSPQSPFFSRRTTPAPSAAPHETCARLCCLHRMKQYWEHSSWIPAWPWPTCWASCSPLQWGIIEPACLNMQDGLPSRDSTSVMREYVLYPYRHRTPEVIVQNNEIFSNHAHHFINVSENSISFCREQMH